MKKNLLIVGASRGIGAAVAEFYDANGDNVISVSRTPSKIGEWVGADISTPGGIKKVIKAASVLSLDALLFMGGVWEKGAFTEDYDFEKSSHTETQSIIDVNLIAPIEITKGLLENLRKAENPRAIFMGATSGLEVSNTLEVAYSASKFGLRGAVHALRLGFEKEGIGFTVINPGYVGTKEVLEDIRSGQSPNLVPIPMADVILAVDFVLRSSRSTDVGDITLTQKFVS
ncbi:SDR family NAD(P)-dependent oxidoreductase [Aliidiomarina soli]|uniref:Oxidoreductase n=1 Tax=Aliidiomarina soli TaxID=1928574 RepID=A0A432WMV3_9GAMM|nr:SDR family NAD(P)-dependent oxidoreductase [Aliidiomarina soli]RUO35094.1 oxidoreductase [Aliidiomarina soli]